MLGYGLSPCCCGRPSCLIFKDNFDRLTGLGSGWIVVSGAAAITNDRLASNPAGAFLVRTALAHTSEAMSVSAQVLATGFIGTSSSRIIVNYKDSSNYLYVQFDFVYDGVGAYLRTDMKFYRRSGGADTQLGSTQTLTAQFALATRYTVCYDGVYLWSSGHRVLATKITDGFYAGLQYTGTLVGQFDSFRWYRWDPLASCPICEPSIICYYCDTAFPPPYRWKVNLGAGGWTNGDCSACTSVLGDYVLTYVIGTGIGVGFGGACRWCYGQCGFCSRGTHCTTLCTKASLDMDLSMIPGSTTGTFKWRYIVSIPSACCHSCDRQTSTGPRDPIDDSAGNRLCISPTDENLDRFCQCSNGLQGRWATFDSANVARTGCATSPVTLTKIADYDYYGSIPGKTARCGGSLPASITMTAV